MFSSVIEINFKKSLTNRRSAVAKRLTALFKQEKPDVTLGYTVKPAIYGAIAGNAWAAVASKFPASIINAAVAMIAAPIFYHAVVPALKAGGILRKLDEAAK